MYRWENCPGSVKLSQGIPSRTSAYAKEGTLAHTVAEITLTGKGKMPDQGVTPEMLTHATEYAKIIRADMTPDSRVSAEKRFHLKDLHPLLFGTNDASVYSPDLKLLRIYDYKYGKGMAVEAAGNSQLLYYGLGALMEEPLAVDQVELVIIQPRCFHEDGPVRRWIVDFEFMTEFAARLKEAAERTELPNAPIVAGEWCRFCPAGNAGKCPELAKRAQAVVNEDFSQPVETYSPEKLRQALEWAPILTEWAKGVHEFAYQEAARGKKIPGYKLVAKRARRTWKDETAVKDFVHGEGMDSVAMEWKLKTPAAVERAMEAFYDKEALKKFEEKFVEKVSTGTTLVPEDDKRPEALTGPEACFAN